jgi:hypothetical protein
MGAGSNERRTFEFDGHTFLWPSGLNPNDMLAACLSIFLDLASRAHRGDVLAAELLRNAPFLAIRAADGRAYWHRERAGGEDSGRPDPAAQDAALRPHGHVPDAAPGPKRDEGTRREADEVRGVPTEGKLRPTRWRAWVAAAVILAAIAVGAFTLIATRQRGAAAPPEAGPGVHHPRAAPGESNPPAALRGEHKP